MTPETAELVRELKECQKDIDSSPNVKRWTANRMALSVVVSQNLPRIIAALEQGESNDDDTIQGTP